MGLFDEDEVRRISHQIAEEFEITYGRLEEKVRRVPDEAAQEVADKFGVPVEVARVAYRVMLDGVITDIGKGCEILMREFSRRERVGLPVPKVGTYVMTVALNEGKWIEYLYGRLSKVLLREMRNLENLARSVSEEVEPASEQVMAILTQRSRIGQVYLKSIIQRWINDHERSTIADAIYAIAGGLLGPNTDSVEEAINGAKAALLIRFRRYEQFLQQTEESRMLPKTLEALRRVIDEIQIPLEHVSGETATEILIELIPPPKLAIDDKSKYGFAHPAFPASGRVGPQLTTPLDFLERDIWLAVMKEPAARDSFLREKVSAVIDALISEGVPLGKVGSTIIFDMDKRFPWKRSKKTVVRQELRELKIAAGENYRQEVEEYVLENLLSKISQLRSSRRKDMPRRRRKTG